MKAILLYISKHKLFVLFLFLFSWVLTLKNSLEFAYLIGNYIFHFDTSFWVFLNALILFISIDFIKKKIASARHTKEGTFINYIRYFSVSLVFYMVYINLFGLFIAFVFDTFSQNYASTYQVVSLLFNQITDFLIYGGFSLAYLYFLENKAYQQRINNYDLSLSKSKIQQLKGQLNPHFLFNNLNILDQLIDEDKEKASNFLSQFSELYRYALNSSEKELISIQEELEFAQNYFEMMAKKYEGYYQLNIDASIRNIKAIVPPFCLQVLIENAITHNLGTQETPVLIDISVNKGIEVSNNKVEQSRKRNGNGVALKNLAQQFQLLSNQPLLISDEVHAFSLTLPLIKMHSND